MSSLKKSKRNMKYSGCPLNSKMIQDVWRLTRKNNKHRLMETKLSEKHFNKDAFSRMTVSLAVQLLSSSVVTMLKKATNDITIIPDIRLKSSQYDKIIELAEKVDCLVDICNGRSKKQGHYTAYFTPENAISIQKELLGILAWFNKWHDKVNSIENNANSFLPIQSWKSLQSLVLGLVGLIQANVIEEKQTIVPRTTNTDGIENHFSCSRQNGGSGDAPTAQEQQTNDARASAFTVTAGPSKGNNLELPNYF